MEGICVNFLDQVVSPIPQQTLPWQPILWQNCGKITYPLHLSLCHYETEWDIALRIYTFIAPLIAVHRVKKVKIGSVFFELK